jgi:hypothetical protein
VPLGNLASEAHPSPRSAVGGEDIADIEADQLGEAETRTQCQREEQVVPRMACRGPPQASLLGFGQGLGGEVVHGAVPPGQKEAILAERKSSLHVRAAAALEESCQGCTLLRGLLS